ncbi:MAG: hypothetical protein J6S09_09940 [Paludibacteraceae bacterium]|nr:hypothetical protein [Paludibacteraceae bacterium]
MNKQSINDQLELLRLKELFMSDIKIRSKMTELISSDNERTDFKKFCEFTHCEPRIAKMLSQLWVIDMILTPEEIAAERKRLEALSYWNDNRQSLEKLAPCISILQDHQFAKSEAIIDGYNCELHMLLSNNELLGILCIQSLYGAGMGGGIESLISQYIKSEFKNFFTHEERSALVKRFKVDSYEEAFDWYKNVLDNFMQLDEATK